MTSMTYPGRNQEEKIEKGQIAFAPVDARRRLGLRVIVHRAIALLVRRRLAHWMALHLVTLFRGAKAHARDLRSRRDA